MNFSQKNILEFIIVITILILSNTISSFIFYRIDLTAEKRFSLSVTTKELVEKLDDHLYIKVYLDDTNLPVDFKRLSNETQLMLNELNVYSKNFHYEFINPLKGKNEEEQNAIYLQLTEKGILPTSIEVKNSNVISERLIFPGAIISYKGKEIAVNLLKNSTGISQSTALNNSVEELEYTFANAIKKIQQTKKPTIAFLEGNGMLEEIYVKDISTSLSEYYNVQRFNLKEFEADSNQIFSINNQLKRIEKNDLIIIAKPTTSFTNLDKFLIDQFIMNGGKSLWFVDGSFIEMDSLAKNNEANAIPSKSLNIDDLLFKYGIRLRNNLIKDISCAPILVPGSYSNGNIQWKLDNWFYMPLLNSIKKHPITNNTNPIKGEFVSSIDTIRTSKSKKTILLQTSPYSKLLNTPKLVTLNELSTEPKEEEYNQKHIPCAVLIEGKFESIFKNRLKPKEDNLKIKNEINHNKLIFISDGDIIKNQVHNLEVIPLGIDKWTYSRTRHQYGNKEFILNCIDYLMDESELINARNKNIELRMLDLKKIKEQSVFWKTLNTILPILIVILFGVIQFKIKKIRYGK